MHTPPLPRKTQFWKLIPAGPALRDGTTTRKTRPASDYRTGPDSVFRCGMRLGSVQRVYSDAERVRGHPVCVFRCGMRLGSVQRAYSDAGRIRPRRPRAVSARSARALPAQMLGHRSHGMGGAPDFSGAPRAARMNCFPTLGSSLSVTSTSEAQEVEAGHATSSMEATSAAGQSTRAPTRSRM